MKAFIAQNHNGLSTAMEYPKHVKIISWKSKVKDKGLKGNHRKNLESIIRVIENAPENEVMHICTSSRYIFNVFECIAASIRRHDAVHSMKCGKPLENLDMIDIIDRLCADKHISIHIEYIPTPNDYHGCVIANKWAEWTNMHYGVSFEAPYNDDALALLKKGLD